ncbi:MAG: type II toxin-antitoxin system RelE/ParE family toxin [Trebonia sp.]
MLDDDTYQQVIAALRELRDQGPALGRPLADTVRGSRHKNMKELRPGSAGRSEIRILFAFDLERQAVLLVAGDKAGRWQRWYRRAISIADDRFDEHIEMLRKREHHG